MINKLFKAIKRSKEILGLNQRGLYFIRPYNPKYAKKIADNKLLSKKKLSKAGIPVPKTIKVFRKYSDVESFNFEDLPKSFVIKPSKGARGGGIEIIFNKNKENKWIGASGKKYSSTDLKALAKDIIDGRYSLFNQPDYVLIEERVKTHKNFKNLAYKGAPDIRIIVFNKIPTMSYIRIPTVESEGKANLDLGAIGAGIDIAVGKTTHAIIGKSKAINFIPDKNLSLSGIKIPYWDKILRLAIEASKITHLGYGAIDFLIDRDIGPVIVELNARPGLSIQLANDDGLLWRLEKAKNLKVKSVEQGIRLGKDLFGGEIEEEIEQISGKKVIGIIEKVKLVGINGKEIEVPAKIDTGADRTSIHEDIFIELGYAEAINYYNSFDYPLFSNFEAAKKVSKERDLQIKSGTIKANNYIKSRLIVKSAHGFSLRPIIDIQMIIDGIEILSNATASKRDNLENKVIIGKKDLTKFIIDPSKK